MFVTIASIEVAGPDRRARRLVFDSHAGTRLTSASVVKSLGLVPGAQLERSELLEDIAATEIVCARERALRIVSYRERSSVEVRRRLMDDGYPADLASKIVDEFSELAFIDDARFAGAWVRGRRSAGVGRVRIRRELLDRGIDAEFAEALLGDEQDGATELARAHSVLRGRLPGSHAERDRLVARLVRRGFTAEIARQAVGEVRDSNETGL